MTSEQAKTILEVFRPGGRDANDPRFAEALQQLDRNPELARWFAGLQAFDARFAEATRSIPVPPGLKAALLAPAPRVMTPPSRNWRRLAAVAASVVLLGLLVALWVRRGPTQFAEFRQELIEHSWDHTPHLELASGNLTEVRQWLARHDASGDFKMPPALQDMPVRGCCVIESRGRKASLLCLADGPRHLHLFVIDGMSFPDLPPPQIPDFEKCAGWKTVSWRQGERTYVLSGMNYPTFVKKFRKSSHWLMEG